MGFTPKHVETQLKCGHDALAQGVACRRWASGGGRCSAVRPRLRGLRGGGRGPSLGSVGTGPTATTRGRRRCWRWDRGWCRRCRRCSGRLGHLGLRLCVRGFLLVSLPLQPRRVSCLQVLGQNLGWFNHGWGRWGGGGMIMGQHGCLDVSSCQRACAHVWALLLGTTGSVDTQWPRHY